jgi:hypothetical protein
LLAMNTLELRHGPQTVRLVPAFDGSVQSGRTYAQR